MKRIKRNIFTVLFALVLVISFNLMTASPVAAATVTAVASGNWDSTTNNAPWPGGVVPAATDTVVIPSPFTVTLMADATIAGLTVDSGGKLAFGANNVNFTVNGDVSGAGTIQPVGGVIIKLTGDWNFSGTISNQFMSVYFTGSGDQTIASTATANWRTISNALKTGGTLFIGTTPTLTTFPQLYTSDVSYNRDGDQLVLATNYNNLALAASGIKTTTSITVDGILSMEGTATASAAPTYGSLAGLQYNTATARTASVEWITPFTATGGVTIASTGTITLDAAKVFNASVPLTINSGATLVTADFPLTFGGNFVNAGGTFTAGTSPITIGPGTATQSIGGFTATGLVSMTKTGGTATFTGNVSGVDLTINGAGGTLNLGTGLTHAFTGAWTRTAGTLNGGSSTLNIVGTISGTGGTFTASTGTVGFTGGSAQSVTGAMTFYNLTLNNSNGLTINNDEMVSNTLTLTSGNITTGSNTVIIGASGSVSGAGGSNFIRGNLRKNVATGATTRTFEVGSTNYEPVTVAFGNVPVAGDLTVKATAGQHANIGTSTIISSKDVDVYWSITNDSIVFDNYSVTFTFVSGDILGGANTANFIVGKYSSGWTYPAVGTKTATSTQATGLTSFSDFVVGELSSVAPTVTTQAVTSIGSTNATGNGNITDLGVPNPTEHGVVWKTSSGPTTSDNKTTDGAVGATGAFTSNITGLSAGTIYYVKAYATNDAGTVYGNEVSFTTLAAPAVTTEAVSSIGTATATGNGTVVSDGGSAITERGIVWSTGANPTTSSSKVTTAGTTGVYTGSITGLTAGTLYHVRAYATNAIGTSYGSDVTFTALKVPAVGNQAVNSISYTTATGRGNVEDLGVPSPMEHGVVWSSTSSSPTTSDNKTTDGAVAVTGAFTSNITGLAPETVYYVRAYATNAAGTVYGIPAVTFMTLSLAVTTVTTQAVSDIGTTTAIGNGTVVSDGGSSITERGIVWGTSLNPTTVDSAVTAAGTTGSYTGSISGLTPGTLYHVRAYAINAVGTGYGDDVTFTALKAPTVITQAVTSTGSTNATGNGNVTDLGVPNPTEHGVVWKTSSGPTTSDNKTTDGAVGATGAFTSNITGLSAGTLYYVKAYATNDTGTVYGSEVTFTTLAAPTATTNAASSITSTAGTLNGTVNAKGASSNVTFKYGTVSDLSSGTTITAAAESPVTGSSNTSVSLDVSGLTSTTTYYFHVLAVNSVGSTNGTILNFTTLRMPTVTTQAVTSIGSTNATGNGNVTDLGVPNPTEHGVVWKTSSGPTTSDNKTTDGAVGATGAFTSNITGLSAGTLYYVKAYATNDAGTVYGSEVTFTTLAAPTATTSAANSITSTAGTLNGTVNAKGSSTTVTFKYGTVADLSSGTTITTADESPVTGSSNTSVSLDVNGLTSTTTYYFQVLAVNSVGSTNGAILNFTTLAAPSGGGDDSDGGDDGDDDGDPTPPTTPLKTTAPPVPPAPPEPVLLEPTAPPVLPAPPITTVPAAPPLTTITTVPGTPATDTQGNPVTVTGGVITVTSDKQTSTVTFPVLLLQGATLGSITDTNGLTFADNALVFTSESGAAAKNTFFNIVDEISNLSATLTIKTGDAVTNGNAVSAQVESIKASAKFTMKDFANQDPSLGEVASTVSLSFNTVPIDAEVKIATTLKPDLESGSAFQLAATTSGMGRIDVAYVINVTKTNLENGTDIKSATITMKAGTDWVKAHGDVNAIKIIHYDPETKTQEILETHFLGYDEQGRAIFEGISPTGLSVFALVGLPPQVTAVASVVTWPFVVGGIIALVVLLTLFFVWRRSKMPTVTTQAVTSIGNTLATANGNVTDLGRPKPTEHGVVWKTSTGPTTSDSKTTDGKVSDKGAFTSSIIGLSAGTLYYVRAYATNSAGTVYGSEVTFTTL